MVGGNPFSERAVFLLQRDDPARVLNGGVHFQAVPDDAGIGEQPGAVGCAVGRHNLGHESAIGLPERLALLEDREP